MEWSIKLEIWQCAIFPHDRFIAVLCQYFVIMYMLISTGTKFVIC